MENDCSLAQPNVDVSGSTLQCLRCTVTTICNNLQSSTEDCRILPEPVVSFVRGSKTIFGNLVYSGPLTINRTVHILSWMLPVYSEDENETYHCILTLPMCSTNETQSNSIYYSRTNDVKKGENNDAIGIGVPVVVVVVVAAAVVVLLAIHNFCKNKKNQIENQIEKQIENQIEDDPCM